jgi:hypothetical protein
MAKYMDEVDIDDYLQEGLEEEGTIEKAFDYLLEHNVRDLFEMNDWDEPAFTELIIDFNDIQYKVNIESDGCCEATDQHRIMYWKWTVTPIN